MVVGAERGCECGAEGIVGGLAVLEGLPDDRLPHPVAHDGDRVAVGVGKTTGQMAFSFVGLYDY